MNKIFSLASKLILVFCLTLFSNAKLHANGKVKIEVDQKLLSGTFSGRVYAVIAPKSDRAMPLQANFWFQPIEIMSKEVVDWDTKTPLYLSRKDDHYLKASDVEHFEMQVLFRVNKRDANPFTSVGNIYSDAVSLTKEEVATLGQTVTATNVIDIDSKL